MNPITNRADGRVIVCDYRGYDRGGLLGSPQSIGMLASALLALDTRLGSTSSWGSLLNNRRIKCTRTFHPVYVCLQEIGGIRLSRVDRRS